MDKLDVICFFGVGWALTLTVLISIMINNIQDINTFCGLGNQMLDELYSHRMHFPDTVEHIQHYSEQLEQRCN